MTKNSSAKPLKPNGPDSNSTSVMDRFDRMPRNWRDLVNEYGWNVVEAMIADGHRDAAKLAPELEDGRERKQAAWLAEIPYGRLSATRPVR